MRGGWGNYTWCVPLSKKESDYQDEYGMKGSEGGKGNPILTGSGDTIYIEEVWSMDLLECPR